MGSSSIIAVVESLSDAYWIYSGQISPTLSKQQLIDCAPNVDDPPSYFSYLVNQGGIDSEESYPYTGEPGPCKATEQGYVMYVKNFTQTVSGNETELACAIAFHEPTTICLDASQSSFQFYDGGVYSDPQCSTTSLDHCMIATGYASQAGTDYWIVENSWGIDWGTNGFIWIARNQGNMCGIATLASFPGIAPL